MRSRTGDLPLRERRTRYGCVTIFALAGALLVSPAAAEFPGGIFPATPVLDDFNRPDQGPSPGSQWVNTFNEGLRVIGQQAHGDTLSDAHASAWRHRLPANQEVFATFADTPGTTAGSALSLRRQTLDAYTDGYLAMFYRESNRADEVSIWKASGFQDTCLVCNVSLPEELGAGDQIGFRAVGPVLQAYLNGALVAWAVDFEFLTDGYIDLYTGDVAGAVFDDFGGGLVPACADGLDNDGDGLTDFGMDPECTLLADRAETAGCGLLGIEVALVSLLAAALNALRGRAGCGRPAG